MKKRHADKISKQTRTIERKRREAEREHELELLKFKNTCQDKFGKKWKSCYDELKNKAQKALDERLEAEKSVALKHHSSANEFARKVERLKKDLKKHKKSKTLKINRIKEYHNTWYKNVELKNLIKKEGDKPKNSNI